MFVDSSASGPPSVYSSLTLALVTSTWWHSLQISVRIVIIAVMLCSILNSEEMFEHVYLAVCDETQNLNDTDSETFFRYQIFSRPIPRLFSVPKIFETDSETFFWYQIFSRPILRAFLVTKFVETDSKTFFRYQNSSRLIPRLFFGTQFFRDRFRDFFRYQFFFETGSDTIKNCKNPGNGTRPGPKSTLIF